MIPAFLIFRTSMKRSATLDPAAAIEAARIALSKGEISTAERLCTQVLASGPQGARAWAILTETALLRNRPDAAIVCAERAATLLPHDPIGHILRAKCLMILGESVRAHEAAETALQRVGTAPEALDALGAIFGRLGQHQTAAQLLQRAVAARPDIPQYLFNLAATERMTGNLAAAELHCDAAIALDPHYCLAYYLRADLRTQTHERNHIAQMESLLRAATLGWHGETLLHFALAKELEDLGEHARAIDHVVAGGDLHRRSIQYEPSAEISNIDRIIRTQTRAWLGSFPAGFAEADPVFVVGLPRTGTTLIERIIASHSAVVSAGETNTFAAELHRETKVGSGALEVANLGRRYVEAVTAFAVPRNTRFIDKTLQNYLHCGIIHAALPRAKIILVHRHPLDACWAMYKAHFQEGLFSFSYDQLELAEYYLAFRRLAEHWRSVLPAHALLEVRYEDVVAQQAAQSRRITDFVGLPWEEDVLRFHESKVPSATASAVQVRRPIYSSSVGKWRFHAQRLGPLHARLARAIPSSELA
jgi:tetratricopeptide (TPR) repeat protein